MCFFVLFYLKSSETVCLMWGIGQNPFFTATQLGSKDFFETDHFNESIKLVLRAGVNDSFTNEPYSVLKFNSLTQENNQYIIQNISFRFPHKKERFWTIPVSSCIETKQLMDFRKALKMSWEAFHQAADSRATVWRKKKKVQCIDARHRRGFPGKSGVSAAGLMSRLLPKGRQVGTQRYWHGDRSLALSIHPASVPRLC